MRRMRRKREVKHSKQIILFILCQCIPSRRLTKISSISARKHRKEEPVAKPTVGGKNIASKHPDAKGKAKSPVPMVIKPTENGSYHYLLVLPT